MLLRPSRPSGRTQPDPTVASAGSTRGPLRPACGRLRGTKPFFLSILRRRQGLVLNKRRLADLPAFHRLRFSGSQRAGKSGWGPRSAARASLRGRAGRPLHSPKVRARRRHLGMPRSLPTLSQPPLVCRGLVAVRAAGLFGGGAGGCETPEMATVTVSGCRPRMCIWRSKAVAAST